VKERFVKGWIITAVAEGDGKANVLNDLNSELLNTCGVVTKFVEDKEPKCMKLLEGLDQLQEALNGAVSMPSSAAVPEYITVKAVGTSSYGFGSKSFAGGMAGGRRNNGCFSMVGVGIHVSST
jgi:hypothetical protein